MKALCVTHFSETLEAINLLEIDKPKPVKGEVLIKVECGGAFPADNLLLSNDYIIEPELPFTCGRMGVGRVVENGGGFLGRRIMGRRVFFGTTPDRGGSWAEYSVASSEFCVPVGIQTAEAAVQMGNGLTAAVLLRLTKEKSAKALIVNAAASSLGKQINFLAQAKGVPLINIIRSDEQASLLKSIGAEHILDQKSESFETELKALAHELEASLAIDSVGGPMPQLLLDTMPEYSTVTHIGNLSGQDAQINTLKTLTARHQKLEGFEVAGWLAAQNLWTKLSILSDAKRLGEQLASITQARLKVSLEQAECEPELLFKDTTKGVALIYPE